MPRKNKKKNAKNKRVRKHKKLSKKQHNKKRILKSKVSVKKSEKVIKQKESLPESEKQQPSAYFSPAELEEFRNLLISRKILIEELLKNREDDLTKSSIKGDTGNLSSIPQHLAEMGSQEYNKNLACIMLESIQKELKEILAALERLNDNKYGICTNCNKPINKERLKVLPYTNLCLDCKILEENSLTNP